MALLSGLAGKKAQIKRELEYLGIDFSVVGVGVLIAFLSGPHAVALVGTSGAVIIGAVVIPLLQSLKRKLAAKLAKSPGEVSPPSTK